MTNDPDRCDVCGNNVGADDDRVLEESRETIRLLVPARRQADRQALPILSADRDEDTS